MVISKTGLTQIGYFLGLQCKMIYRLIRPLGWIRIAILFFLLGGVGVSLVKLSVQEYGSWYLVLFIALLLFSVQLFRKDQRILRTMRLEPFTIYATGYLILALPFVALLLLNSAFLQVSIALLICPLIALVPQTNEIQSRKFITTSFFTSLHMPFEWISGFRNKGMILLILLLTGFIAGWFDLIAGWVLTIIITGLIASFYKYCESKDFIRLTAHSPTSFITKKIGQGVACYFLTSSILWIELVFLYPNEWLYTGMLLGANILLLILIISGKYAFYLEHKNIELVLSLLFGVGVLCLMIPFLMPVTIFLIGWVIKRGNKFLKREVYDIH